MTVNTISSIAEFDTNGVTTNFPFYFKFLANEDLVVTYVDPQGVSSTLTLGTHYTVNGAGNDQGGSIVTTSALSGPGQLIVSREMEAFQQTSLRNQGKFLAETHEDVFDKLTMLIQQGLATFTRALKRPMGRDYFFAENRRIASVKDPVDDQDAATKAWSQRYVGEVIGGVQGPINNSANVLYVSPSGVPGVVQDLSGADGSYLVGRGSGTVGSALDDLQNQVLVLKAKTDGTDQTAVVQAFFARAFSENRPWMVPPGDYTINPSAPIYIKTSGVCHGRFLVPKSNQTFYFYVVRDEPGSVISTAGWAFAPNRGNSSVGAFNAVGKNLFIASTEILMERFGEGGPYTPYFKQEFIRCPLFNGSFSTAAVRNYIDLSKMIVTAHTPSKPIEVSGLGVLLTGASGGVESNRGSIVVMRDNAVINQPYIHNENPGQPKPIALEVSYCADVTINQPDILGFNYPGLGYGILSGTTIGLTINGGSVQDCRHAYTDAFTVDTIINGGSWSYVIDSHWCDRFTANDVHVSALPGSSAFSMCGDDITLNRPKQSGGRNLLGIRTDTPQMGGQIKIIAPEINSFGVGSDSFYIFGFTSPGGTGPIGGVYTQRPRLPDLVEISDVKFTSDAEILYGARLGTLQAAHTAWGVVKLSGVWTMSGQTTVGIYAEKNSNFQQDRAPLLINDAYMDCGSNGTAIYVAAADGVTTRAMNVRLSNLVRGSLRYSGHGVNVLKASKSSILSIVDDNPSAPSIGMSAFNDCLMLGGAVSTTLKNLSFQGSQFTGNYATFPLAANVTMVGNVKSSTVTGLPADIRGNVAPPFN